MSSQLDSKSPTLENQATSEEMKGKSETEDEPTENTTEQGPSTPSSNSDKQSSEPAEKPATEVGSTPTTDWQAIWSPAHNAYYFYNSRTSETTWINPLQPSSNTPTASTSTADPSPSGAANPTSTSLQDAAIAQGIDPELAFLDPTLLSNPTAPAGAFKAKFNARTGAFTAMDARDPSHLSEAERAKRMSSIYFDVAAWEQEIQQRYAQIKEDEEAGKSRKRKRPTKADLERFKQQKKARKIAKTAWLRE